MKKYVVGIYNGFDVDDYYIEASSADEANEIARTIAEYTGGELYLGAL